MGMTQSNETQAPTHICAYDDGLGAPDSRTWSDTYPIGKPYILADLAAAQTAVAWLAGRDAAVKASNAASAAAHGDMPYDAAIEFVRASMNPPADASAALDRLIAERVRESVRPIKEAWDWWQADSYDRCASVVSDAIDEALAAPFQQPPARSR